MDNTPDSPEALREHFSRRASAARIALRKLARKESPKPSPEKPPLPDNFPPLFFAGPPT